MEIFYLNVKHFEQKLKDYELIQNDNQNIDGVDQHPKLDSHYYLFICDILFITLQLWCCFMSDDRVRLHVEASVVTVSSSLVFLGLILYRRCVLAPRTV